MSQRSRSMTDTTMDPMDPVRTDAPADLAAPADPTVKESSPQQRLEAVLAQLQEQARHNAPVPPSAITELQAIVNAGRGLKGPVPVVNSFPNAVVVGTGAKVAILHSAAEALDYVRALPAEVWNRPHWQAAEKALLTALDFGEPAAVNNAAAALTLADGIDANAAYAAPVKRAPFERLPDGRIREDRFPDRKLAPPLVATPAPIPQAPEV